MPKKTTKIDEIKSTIENSDGEVILEFSTHISVKDGADIHSNDVLSLLQSHGKGILKSVYTNLKSD